MSYGSDYMKKRQQLTGRKDFDPAPAAMKKQQPPSGAAASAASDSPSVGERIGAAFTSVGKRRVAGHAATAESGLRGAKFVDQQASEDRRRAEAETRNAQHYRDMLARGTAPDGKALTDAQRQQFKTLADRADRNAKIYGKSLEAQQQPLTRTIDRVDQFGDRMQAAADQDYIRGTQELGTLGKAAFDVGTGALDLAADLAENMVAPGLGTASRVSRTYGSGAEQAQEAGANLGQQMLTGAAMAGIGEDVNRMFSGNPILVKATGKGALDDLLLPGLGKSLPGRMAKSGLGEAIEEGVENAAGYGARKLIYDHEGQEDFDPKGLAYESAIAGVLGGLTGLSGGHQSQAEPRYTAAEADTIRQEGRTFRNLVAGVDTTVADFFNKWRGGRSSQAGEKLEKLYLSGMNEDVRQQVSRIVGYPVDHRDFIVTNDDVRHILEHHGDPQKELSKDNIPLEPWMFDQLPNVVGNPDVVEPGAIGSGKKNAGKQAVIFSKTFPGGNVVTVQFDNKGRNTMEITTMYAKKEGAPSKLDTEKTSAPNRTSETLEPAPSIKSIDDSEREVNPGLHDDYNGIGGADAGTLNSRFDDLQAQSEQFYPEGPGSSRPTDIPTHDFDGRRISRAAVTEAGARAIPDEAIPLVEDLIAAGKLSYTEESNRTANRRAGRTIKDKGYQGAVEAFTQAVARGESSADLTALGARLLNNAANAGDGQTMAQLLVAYTKMRSNTAQALQAGAILKKMRPEHQLYAAQKIVEEINTQNEKQGRKPAPGAKGAAGQEASAPSAVRETLQESRNQAAKTVAREMAERAAAPRAPQPRQRSHAPADLPTGDWWTEIGDQLAEQIGKRTEPQVQKPTPVTRIVQGDLLKFAENYALPNRRITQPKRTAAMRIRDFFHNREKYVTGWRQAKRVLQEKYQHNPEALEALDQLLTDGSILYTGAGDDAVMFRAITDAALQGDQKIRDLVVRAKLGDEAAVAERIYRDLNEQVQVTGKDAEQLYNAVRSYVGEELTGKDLDIRQRVDTDLRKTLKGLEVKMGDVIRQGAESREALAERLSELLIREYGISEEAAGGAAQTITGRFEELVRQTADRQLEVMFADRPAREQAAARNEFQDLANMGAFFDPRYGEAATGRAFGTEGVTLREDLVAKFLQQPDQEGRDAVMQEIYRDIARQLPGSFQERANAWRYMSMLLNPTTHVRNVVGNLIQDGARNIKNAVGTVLEKGLVKDRSQRTKSVLTHSVEDQGRRDLGRDLYEQDRAVALGEQKWQDTTGYNAHRDIQKYRQDRLFGESPLGRGVQKVYDFGSKSLDAEDVAFNRPAYINSFAQALKARGITADQARANPNDPAVMGARNYAIREAQKATYRNTTALSEALSKAGSYHGKNPVAKTASFLFDALMPFRKTPANILTTGIEFSPAGFAKTAYDAMTKLKTGEMDAAQVVDQLAANLTGTGLLVLGAALAQSGVLTGHVGEEDNRRESKYRQQLGEQDYALNLDGGTYTLDWAVPAAMPLFAGAALAEAHREDQSFLDGLAAALNDTTQVVLETSMLSSLDQLLSGISYADNKVQYVAGRTLSNYASQYVPTLGGRVASVLDPTVRKSFTEQGTGQASKDLSFFGQGVKKIPGLRQTLQPAVDLWGNEVSNGEPVQRLTQAFLSPGYYRKKTQTPVDQELLRLGQTLGDPNLYPADAPKELSGGKVLTAEEYTRYAKSLGKTRFELLDAAVESPFYGRLTDGQKAEYVQKVYAYTKATTDKAFGGKGQVDRWMTNVPNAQRDLHVSPAEMIGLTITYGTRNFSGDGYEKVKEGVRAGLSVEDYFRFKTEAPALNPDPKRSKTNIDQSEVTAWAMANGYGDQIPALRKLVNSKWK